MHKIFLVAEGQTIVINCNGANKSCLLKFVHTKNYRSFDAILRFINLATLQTLKIAEHKTMLNLTKNHGRGNKD